MRAFTGEGYSFVAFTCKCLHLVMTSANSVFTRMMSLAADGRDYQRQIYQLVSESHSLEYMVEGLNRACKSWLGARKRFRDVAAEEQEACWAKLFKDAVNQSIWEEQETKP